MAQPSSASGPRRGGARPGAGRPRTASLTERELRLLAHLVELTDREQVMPALVVKLRHMADRVARTGR